MKVSFRKLINYTLKLQELLGTRRSFREFGALRLAMGSFPK
jgi:hypothetical protein